jgi:hypothetical protein
MLQLNSGGHMKNINVVNGPANASAIILGCMRMPALSLDQAEKLVHLKGRI